MAIRIVLAFVLLATSKVALAAPLPSETGPSLQWDAPAACPPGGLLAHVGELVGLDREGLAAKLLRIGAVVRQQPDGNWEAQLAIETIAGSGERRFEGEDCRSLLDGTALIVALAIDPTINVPRPTSPARKGPAGTAPAQSGPEAPRPRYLVRPLVGADLGILPEVGLAYGLAAGATWRRVRIEIEGTSQPSQETTNASGHGGRIHLLLDSSGRICGHPMQSGRIEPAACLGASLAWLRSTGLNILQPETHDSFAVALFAGAALGLRLRDWLWLRVEGAFGVSVRRPRFEIGGSEEVYRVRSLTGRVAGGVEFRL